MRQSPFWMEERRRGVGSVRVGLLALVVLVWTGWGGVPLVTTADVGSSSLATGVVSGLFVAGAAIAAVVSLRRHAERLAGWAAVAGALIAGQALLVALPTVAHAPVSTTEQVTVVLFGILGTALVLGALLGLPRATYVADESFGIGLGTGFLAAGHLLLLIPLDGSSAIMVKALMVVLGGTHLVAAFTVVGLGLLSRRMAWLVAATVVVVAGSLALVVAGLGSSTWTVASSMALAAVGAAWIATAWDCVQDSLRRSSEAARRERATLAAAHAQRERLHELRSTVAGLVNGSALIDNAAISDATRAHLWESVRRELDRMQRLLSEKEQKASQMDLDETMCLILDLQRLKGRHVELRSHGETVRARYDALAEVVNILMDNAATHGGSDSSLIEVARRDEETVDITVTDFGCGIAEQDRETVFEWGRRRPDSPGEGIGLTVAQRLVAEAGGSLRLAEQSGAGSSFVISLPSPRRPVEDSWADVPADFSMTSRHQVSHLGEDGHVPWRRPS